MMRSLLTALILLAIATSGTPALAWAIEGTLTPAQTPKPAAAPLFGVDAMLVGNQVMTVSDTRQLTLRKDGRVVEAYLSPDGKYVVYILADMRGEAQIYECRLVKVATGKTATLMSRIPSDEPRSTLRDAWSLDDSLGIAWSPDSSVFALKATHLVSETGKKTEQQYIVIFSASGAFRKALPLDSPTRNDDHCQMTQRPLFTPDSRQIAVTLLFPDSSRSEQSIRFQPVVRLFDIGTGRSHDIPTPKVAAQNPRDVFVIWSPLPHTVGWSSDGALLLDGQAKLHKLSLDGSSDEVLAESSPSDVWSSDGAFVVARDGGVSIRAQQAKVATPLVPGADAEFVAWAPSNRMILYIKNESMTDAAKSRKRGFRSLWLSTIDPARPESLCVALDAEGLPSASRDCRAVAYLSQGQLYVAQLSLREPELREKLAAGLPLTEEEAKMLMMTNAKSIGSGLRMYMADHNDTLPPAASANDSLGVYVDPTAFLRPGGKDQVFKWIDPGVTNEGEIQSASSTIVGEMDAGYGWKVVLYFDGHVRTIPKQ